MLALAPRLVAVLGVVLLHGVQSTAEAPIPSTPPLPSASSALPQIPFEKYTLPNGLEVILHEDHRIPEVVVDLCDGKA